MCFLALLLNSCNDSKKSNYSNATNVKVKTTAYTATNHPGKKLMETKCYLCHNPSTSHDSRVAPPMVAIKSHYLSDDTSKKQFTDAIWEFVKQPTVEKIKMHGAVRRFGLMPYQEYKETEIREIANYMYDYKIEEPEWFKKHIEESKGKMQYRNDGIELSDASGMKDSAFAKAQTRTHAEIGMEFALNTKKELGKNLMGTIQKKGTLEAVTFCNERAYPITDSMATAQNATIKRVSDKPRNPKNQANVKELSIIESFKKSIANNEDYQPVTEIVNGEVKFYAPITTNSMCLQCHGSPGKNMEPQVLKTIENFYPEDKALGYGVNEVRGIWSITYRQ